MPFGPTHTLLRGLAGFAFASFWHRVETHTKLEEYPDGDADKLVPPEGTPIIVVANHHNSAADVSGCPLRWGRTVDDKRRGGAHAAVPRSSPRLTRALTRLTCIDV